MHVPVLRDEVVAYLGPRSPGALVVDGTVGEGGHADLFLGLDPTLELVGVDRDPSILRVASERLSVHGSRCRLVHERFSTFFARYPERCSRPADTVFLDLGVSMFHFRSAARGFSFQGDEPLDMRLDPGDGTTAADLVNSLPVEELADLFYKYGEERESRRIARAVVAARPIDGTRRLAEVVSRSGGGRHGPTHPATRVFQALRIAVNDELSEIENGLPAALAALAPGGRIGVISFHSLEDRLVKRIFREERPGYRLVVKKPLAPSWEETRTNRAARSAKLRVLERLVVGA